MQIAELVHKVGKGIVNFLILGGFFQVIFYNFFVCPGLGQRRRRKEVEKDKEARSFFSLFSSSASTSVTPSPQKK